MGVFLWRKIMVEATNNINLLINGSLVSVELTGGRTVPKIGCLGPAGTNTEEAREKFLKDNTPQELEMKFIDNNLDVVRLVDAGDYDLGVVPVENSIEGDVHDVVKGLIKANSLTILAELILHIRHMLIGNEGTSIQQVLSHTQALGQCSNYLDANLPDAQRVPVGSTSGAVEQVLGIPNAAAIASQRAAEIYKMAILAQDIGNIQENTTRFYLIGRGVTKPTGDDLTSMIITPQLNRVGMLSDCLKVLARHGMNLTKIRSFPIGDPRMENYSFLTTGTGHRNDPDLIEAFSILESRYNAPVRVLGSYKKTVLP